MMMKANLDLGMKCYIAPQCCIVEIASKDAAAIFINTSEQTDQALIKRKMEWDEEEKEDPSTSTNVSASDNLWEDIW